MQLKHIFLLLLCLSIFFFSCNDDPGANIELSIIHEDTAVSNARVRFYVPSENASPRAIDSIIYSDASGKVYLSMPGECYLDAVAVYFSENVTYAGEKMLHLIEGKTTIDTIKIY